MKKRQRYWLYLAIVYAAVHLLRDVFQDFGVRNWLSTILAKAGQSRIIYHVHWGVFNTYLIALSEIILAVICLKRGKFGRLGGLTIVIAVVTFSAWLFYWFLF